jgi:hypothetical protein
MRWGRSVTTLSFIAIVAASVAFSCSSDTDHDSEPSDAEVADGSIDGTTRDGTASDGTGAADAAAEGSADAITDTGIGTDAADAANVDLYVNPTTGNDTNSGTLAAPFKNIVKALSVAQANTTVWLADATYNFSNQTQFNVQAGGACDTSNGLVVPSGVTVRATTPRQAKLQFAASYGFCMTGGVVQELALERFNNAFSGRRLVEASSASSTVRGSTFAGCGYGGSGLEGCILASGSSKIAVVADGLSNYLDVAVHRFLVASDTSEVTVSGGAITGSDAITSTETVIYAHNSATVKFDSLTIDPNSTLTSILEEDAAKVELTNVSIGGSNGAAVILAGASFKATSSTIKNSAAEGITIPDGTGATTSIELIDTQVTQNITGMYLGFNNTPTVTLTRTSFDNNHYGLHTYTGQPLTVTIDGGSFSNNSQRGLWLHGLADKIVKMHGATITANAQEGAYIDLSSGSSIDLGTKASPGQNVFGPNGPLVDAGTFKPALTIGGAAITAYAVGNTWIANEQGADNGGHYASTDGGVYDVTYSDGRNHNAFGGVTLRLAEP